MVTIANTTDYELSKLSFIIQLSSMLIILFSLVIVSMSVKKGYIDRVSEILKEIVNLMSEADGCISVQLAQDVINHDKFKIYEKWESEEKQKEFLTLLRENGLFSQLIANLDDMPSSETYKTKS